MFADGSLQRYTPGALKLSPLPSEASFPEPCPLVVALPADPLVPQMVSGLWETDCETRAPPVLS